MKGDIGFRRKVRWPPGVSALDALIDSTWQTPSGKKSSF